MGGKLHFHAPTGALCSYINKVNLVRPESVKILQKQEFLVEQKSVEIVCEVWQIFVNVNMITSAYKSEYSCPLGGPGIIGP